MSWEMFLTRCCQPLGPIAGNPQRLRQKWLHNDKLPYPHESYFHFPAKVNSHSFNYQLFYGILVYCLGTFQVFSRYFSHTFPYLSWYFLQTIQVQCRSFLGTFKVFIWYISGTFPLISQ